jgi:hypothetical protein
LPQSVADRYREALNDDELLSMRDEVALLDTRLGELAQELEVGDSQELWSALQITYEGMIDAHAKGRTRDMAQALVNIGNLIEQGADKWSTWQAICDLMEQRRKLVESERRRLVDLQQYITAERAMLLITAVVKIVARHIDDRKTLRLISADIGELTTAGGAQ